MGWGVELEEKKGKILSGESLYIKSQPDTGMKQPVFCTLQGAYISGVHFCSDTNS